MEELEVIVCDVLTHQRIGTLDASAWSFNDPEEGAGTCSVAVTVPRESSAVEQLRNITVPDRSAVYVREIGLGGLYLWGGPLITRNWDRKSRQLKIQAVQWDQYPYSRLWPSGVTFTNKDDFYIAQQIILTAMSGTNGTPEINVDTTQTDGVISTVTFDWFKRMGEALDQFSQRLHGFKWCIKMFPEGDNPVLSLALMFPERQAAGTSTLVYVSDADGGNIKDYGEWAESADTRVSRMWATGDGQPPAQIVAYDQDPNLGQPSVLLREDVKNYSSVIKAKTLQEHAHQERLYRDQTNSLVTLSVDPRNPGFVDWFTGDRARLIVKDDWLDLDLPAVRITERGLSWSQTSGLDGSIVIDAGDYEAPLDEDSGF